MDGVANRHREESSEMPKILYEPCDRDEYGMREFAVRDLDGYMLAFAEDLHPDG